MLERETRPGGLVRGVRIGEYWFDRVLHLLYFPDTATRDTIRSLVGDVFSACPPVAWVETRAGTTRYPLQMNLRDLDVETKLACIRDLAEVTFGPRPAEPETFEAALLQKFGAALCELFLFPYNRKMWRRDLGSMPATAVAWTVTRPDFDAVLRGAFETDARFRAYNAEGWYPRPPAGSPLRTMEVLSDALARNVPRLICGAEVRSIDLDRREVEYVHESHARAIGFEQACIATIPLPALLAACRTVPKPLREGLSELRYNRVWSVAFCIRGPRPSNTGHWRYFADESLCFNRLVYMHEFDPGSAPEDGWGLMAELTEPQEMPLRSPDEIVSAAAADVRRARALPAGCEVIEARAWVSDPAYIVQTAGLEDFLKQVNDFLKRHDVHTLGRYGRWEYSSMGQVMRDGLALGQELARPVAANVA